MSVKRLLAVLFLVGGILSLIYGGFTYTKETHEAKIGPVDVSVKEKKTVNVPVWAGVVLVVVGGALLLPERSK